MTGARAPLGKDLLGLEQLSADQIRLVLDTAEPLKEISERAIKKVPTLRGATVVNLFFEPSTRTRISFEFAEKRMSADTVNVAVAASSVTKGETLVDTARNLEAMRIDMVVIRHSASGAAHFLAERIESNVINAGDGMHEHPTQGLLDLLTLRDHFGAIAGKRVCICGDVLHSRVARSNIWGLRKLGAEVAVCGPRSLLPSAIGEMGVTVFDRIEQAIEWADALNVLRLQLERMHAGYIPSLREYNRVFGVTRERLARAPRDVLILHPGPMNRGVEIDSDVADGPHSVILDQVTNGVAIRMAVRAIRREAPAGLPCARMTPVQRASLVRLVGEHARRLRDVLSAKGYDVVYKEIPEGHDVLAWCGRIDDALATFLPGG